jgi:DNA invertase Pin-like site-specific DNA recombinase
MSDAPLNGKFCWDYFRASTPKQPGSINDQRIVIDKLIADQGGIKVGESSDVRTGKLMKRRAGIKEIINVVTDKHNKIKVDFIVVHELARLGRSPGQLWWLFDLLSYHGVKIYIPHIGIIDEIMINALGLVAKLLLDANTRNIRRAHDARILSGRHVGRPPHGYKAIEINGQRGYLEITPDAETIRRLFDYYIRGLKLAEILRIFVSEGIRGPRGGRLTLRTLRSWLNNPTYKALNVWGRTKVVVDPITEKEVAVPQPRETWTEHAGLQEPIIPSDVFDAAAIISGRDKAHPDAVTQRKSPGRKTFLTGLFRCPECKGPLNVQGGGQKGQIYLGCASHYGGKSYFADGGELALCSNNRLVRRNLLIITLIDGLEPVLRTPAAIDYWLAVFNKDRNRNYQTINCDHEPSRKRLVVITENLSNLERAIAVGVNPDAFKDKINELHAEKVRLEEAIIDVQQPPVDLRLDIARVEDCLESISRVRERLSRDPLDPIDMETSAILASLIHHGFVFNDPTGKGFEIEVFGHLAYLTSEGQTEVARFRSENFKEMDTYHLRMGSSVGSPPMAGPPSKMASRWGSPGLHLR